MVIVGGKERKVMYIDAIDHVVLTVRDVDAARDWYTTVLGMKPVTFGDGRRALAFGSQKINIHAAGREFEPKAERPTPGSGDLCFITSVPLVEVQAHLAALRIPVLEGPVRRAGATGSILSVYVRDPDGNLIEISNRMPGATGAR
jgi:catechol 2,3-dioxygenase-like lactoylglutathione lyase family enzyme